MAENVLESRPKNEETETQDERVVDPETLTDDLLSHVGDDSPSDPKSPLRKLGLNVTRPWGWSGSSLDEYDVVTVHGLRDDYRTAWIGEDGTWWVRATVFSKKSVRELDYAYDIDEDATIYEPDGIRFHAEALLTAYAQDRRSLDETEADRPILWICHDIGGIIVKEALRIALANPRKYGRLAILTTAIIFLGTPHRFESLQDAEDQLHSLLVLPGPEIRTGILSKVRNLAFHTTRINEAFLETKLLDRAMIFDVFVQNWRHSMKQRRAAGDDSLPPDAEPDGVPDPITPFSRYTHTIGNAFEARWRERLSLSDHADLVRDDDKDSWMDLVSPRLSYIGCIIAIDHQLLQFQANILSLAPPTIGLDTPFDPLQPVSPLIKWIQGHKACKSFSKAGTGPRFMHIYANRDSPVDVKQVSRQWYVDSDAYDKSATQSTIYFEFDQWDSRYNDISSMLIYIINTLLSHFWDMYRDDRLFQEIKFLSDTHSWTLEDLYHLYRTLSLNYLDLLDLTIFISCFDQCPEHQRRWFLERILQERSYTEENYRLIVSTSTKESLGVEGLPETAALNLGDCPNMSDLNDKYAQEITYKLEELLLKRPMYEQFHPQLKAVMRKCESTPYLGHIILTWLSNLPRGRPKSEVASTIECLSPVTAENTVRVFISALPKKRKARAEKILNWIKHAAEPWSLESLAEALAVDEFCDTEPCLTDIDAQGLAAEIEEAFGGIISIANRSIRFSHPSFYLVPEMGLDDDSEDRAAQVNSSIARVCLRYLQLSSVQETLDESSSRMFDGTAGKTPLDAGVISRPRVSMAEYAVQFWPRHYKASGTLKPSHLVRELFANKESRHRWEMLHWLLSNPFVRPQRSYVSELPVYAMLGLEDLIDEALKVGSEQSFFQKDCWLAVAEAARTGHSAIVDKLLQQVSSFDADEMQNALCWGAGQAYSDTLSLLVKRIPDLKTFQWPELLFHRAASAGLDHLLTTMLQSGYDVNTPSSFHQSPALLIAVLRNRVSTAEVLLKSDPKPDLSIKDGSDGDSALTLAIWIGDPRMIALLLENGGSKDEKTEWGQTLIQNAVTFYRHGATKLLIKAGADFQSGDDDESRGASRRQPLIIVADRGGTESARALLNNAVEPIPSNIVKDALHKAVSKGHTEVARLLLEYDPKQDLNERVAGQDMLLMAAVRSGEPELVSHLIEHGAEVNISDPNIHHLAKTPLSQACFDGRLDMVSLLLEKKADINYTEDNSDPPLVSALGSGVSEIAQLLLKDERIDIHKKASDGIDALVTAFAQPPLVKELLARGLPIDYNCISGTVLIRAAVRNKPKTIEVLLKSDPKPDLECVVRDDAIDKLVIGCTALQCACYFWNPKCVKLLLDAGANVDFRNKKGDDALDILLQTNQLDERVEECCKLLLTGRNKSNPNYVNKRGQTRLHFIKETTRLSIVELLVAARVPIDTADEDGYSPLAVAVKAGNEKAAKYLIEQGARVNRFGPKFGSILHLAVASGNLSLVRLLIEAGADREAVDPKYGASLLYTALGIEDDSDLKRMVKYLVDEAKVSVNKYGGKHGYPLIRAAIMVATDQNSIVVKILKFLIARKAQIDVTDSQGRTALHIACTILWFDRVKTLVEAGANVYARDKFGRLPIHFAASISSPDNFLYLLDRCKDMDIDVADQDGWTPLLWAARSGSKEIITKLVEQGADLWIRGRGNGPGGEWSALKLVNFAGDGTDMRDKLRPKERVRETSEGREEWKDSFHRIKPGDRKSVNCDSCRVSILGLEWKCVDCSDDFSLCFKCFSHRSDMHDSTHTFKDIEPLYRDADSDDDWEAAAAEDSVDDGHVGSDEFDLDAE